MALLGFEPAYIKRSGGLDSLLLVGARDILSASYDRESDSFASVVLRPGSAMARYCFREDEACYVESVSRKRGALLVSHEISFKLAGVDKDTRRAVTELMEESSGIVAVAYTNSGERLLIGYSREFGTERALKPAEGGVSTGEKFSDYPTSSVILVSNDTALSLLYTGDVPL